MGIDLGRGRRMPELDHMRRARRLVVVESLTAMTLAAVTLPFSFPVAGAPPSWAQALGLIFVIGLAGANFRVWRAVVSRLVSPGHAAGYAAARRLRRYIAEERRLRIVLAGYLVCLVVVVPLPQQWGWFWFVLTVLAAVTGSVTLVRALRGESRWAAAGY